MQNKKRFVPMNGHAQQTGRSAGKKHRILSFVTAIAGSLLLYCAAQAQTLVAVMQSPLRVLDPMITTAHITADHGYMIYDTLLAIDAQNKIQPQMLEKWQVSADGKTYTFTLRPGLKWHNGKRVNAEDCVASIKRWAEKDQTGQVMMGLATEVKVLDENTFSMSFKLATDIALRALSRTGSAPAFMMPKSIAETPSSQAITEFIGSGPFKFVAAEFKPGVKAVYVKNGDYVPRKEPASGSAGGKVVNLERVEWVTMPDAMTAVNALVKKEIDFYEAVPYDLVPMLKNQAAIKVDTISKVGFQYIYRFNFLYPPFNNRALRQAAMYAVSQDDVLKAIVGKTGLYKKCASVFGCGMPYESSYGMDILGKPNLDKARQLLKEGNYDGTPVVIMNPTDFPDLAVPPVVIAQALRKVGFKVDLQAMDWQTLLTRRASQEPPAKGGWNILATFNLVSDSQNPITNYQMGANGRKAWPGWPDFPRVEEIRKEFAETADPEKLKKLAEEAQHIAIDEGIVVPLGQALRPTAYRTSLQGILDAPLPFFWNIKKNEK